jgi:poly(beta-D-mannuronate) lyase
MKRARPGDEVVLRDGRWTDQKLVVRGAGTAERPITIRAATPGGAVLDGASVLRLAGTHLVVNGLWFQPGAASGEDTVEFRADSKAAATNCVMTECAFTAPDGGGSAATGAVKENRWLSIYGTSNAVTRCYLAGKNNRGATLVVWVNTNAPGHHRIALNHFGPRPALGKNGGETIRVGTSTESLFPEHALVESNLFTRCNGEVEVISNKSCGNTYRANTFIECAGALTLRHGNRCVVEGNFFLGNNAPDTGGIRVIGEDHLVMNNHLQALTGSDARSALTLMNGIRNTPLNGYVAATRATVVFNTVIDCRVPLHVGLSDGGGKEPPSDCVIANNLFRNGHATLVKLETPPRAMRWLGNLYEGKEATSFSASAMQRVDLKLHPAAAGLWRPAADSPARGAAVGEFPAVTTDMDGQPRPLLNADAGADQWSTAPVTRRPLTPGEVGPEWFAGR